MNWLLRGGLGANISQLCEVPVPDNQVPNSAFAGARQPLKIWYCGNSNRPTAVVCQQKANSATARPIGVYASAGPSIRDCATSFARGRRNRRRTPVSTIVPSHQYVAVPIHVS